jgi:hypothetical protein
LALTFGCWEADDFVENAEKMRGHRLSPWDRNRHRLINRPLDGYESRSTAYRSLFDAEAKKSEGFLDLALFYGSLTALYATLAWFKKSDVGTPTCVSDLIEECFDLDREVHFLLLHLLGTQVFSDPRPQKARRVSHKGSNDIINPHRASLARLITLLGNKSVPPPEAKSVPSDR